MLLILAFLQGVTVAPPPPPFAAASQDFRLVCNAVNDATATHTNFGSVFSGRRSAGIVGVSSEHYQTAPEELVFEYVGGKGRMRPPPRMVNHTWHPSGWLDVVDVDVSPDAITGKVQLTWAMHPKVSFDRRTGSVYYSSTGFGSYNGHCEKLDPSARAF